MTETAERIDVVGENCPRCGSPKPHHHPAVQFEGEVQPCSDPWHGSTRLGREALERLPARLRPLPGGTP